MRKHKNYLIIGMTALCLMGCGTSVQINRSEEAKKKEILEESYFIFSDAKFE